MSLFSIRLLTLVALFLLTKNICLAQDNLDTLREKETKLNNMFIDKDGSFVTNNVVKINLLLPGSGNIIYAAGAKEESNLMRGLTLIAGIWSLYNTYNYVYSYLDKDRNTPSRHRTQLFLLSYIVGNILNYKRLSVYNKKIADKSIIEFNNGYKNGYMYVEFVYHF